MIEKLDAFRYQDKRLQIDKGDFSWIKIETKINEIIDVVNNLEKEIKRNKK